MAKTLLILRHAKSDWGDGDVSDHDRPLSERGKRDVPRVGKFLEKHNLLPDAIYCSTAKRARKTAERVLEGADHRVPIHLVAAFYLASPDAYQRVLAESGDPSDRLMVVGHNPGLEQLVQQLTSESVHLGTASLVEVQLEIDSWDGLATAARGSLRRFWRPDEDA